MFFLGISSLAGLNFKTVFRWKTKKKSRKVDDYQVHLKKKRRNEILQKKESKLSKFIKNVKTVAEITDTPIKKYGIYSIVSATIGFFIGLALNNIAISIILAVVSSLLPYFFLLNMINKHKKLIKSQLISVLGSINTQYLSENDFVIAVEKKLPTMPEETRKYFAKFVNMVKVLNMDVVEALKDLDDQIDDFHFHQYIQLAIQAETGESGLKYTMQTIPLDMAEIERVQQEFNIDVHNYRKDFICRIIAFPVTLLFLKTTYNEYYYYLTQHIIGQTFLVFVVIALLILTYKFIQINQDVKMK